MNKSRIDIEYKIKLMEEAEAITNECEDIKMSIIGNTKSPERDVTIRLIAMKLSIADIKMSLARDIGRELFNE